LEEERQSEQAQQNNGQSPSGALNARRSGGAGYTEEVHYENEQSYETENQVEFVE
jgi:hypothetical protein